MYNPNTDIPSKRLLEDYFSSLKKNLDRYISLTSEEEETVVNERIRKLINNEWQRWIPILSTIRFVSDLYNGDLNLLEAIHSKSYQILNNVYGSVTLAAAGFGLSMLVR